MAKNEMRLTRTIWRIVGALALLVGCQHAPMNYELQRRESETLLIPPTPTTSQMESSVQISIGNARHHASVHTDCDVDNPFIALGWKGKTAEVRLKSNSYIEEHGNQIQATNQTVPGVYVTALQNLEGVRNDLLGLGAKGCLGANEDQRLIGTLVEKLPLSPDIGYVLRFGSQEQIFQDLTALNRSRQTGTV
jgi:hypothetical protein